MGGGSSKGVTGRGAVTYGVSMSTTYLSNTSKTKLVSWLKEAAIMVGVASAVLLVVGFMRGHGGANAVSVNERAPRFEVERADGSGRVSSDDLHGKPVVLTFWATWCPSCREELPTLDALYRRFGDRVVFVPVSKESAEAVLRYTTRQNIGVPMYLGASPFKAYGIESIPTTIIIGPDGTVVDEMTGGIDADKIEELANQASPTDPDAPH